MTDYYSQLGQDKWILEEIYPEIEGTFVDIGAGDGVRLSNTKALEENGWVGLCVEPNRVSIKEFIENRPKTKLDTRCVYNGRLVDFKEMEEKDGFYPQTSGIAHDLHVTNDWNQYKNIEVPSVKLHDLLEDWCWDQFTNYLSIDIEGAEVGLLRHADFSYYEFGAITIEHNYRSQDQLKIRNILENKGYELVKKVEFDYFFLNEKLI